MMLRLFKQYVYFVLRCDERGKIEIPDYEIESLTRVLLPDIISFYESEEGRREYEKWKSQQEVNKGKKQE